MATNVFFNNYNNVNEQNLIDDLVIESIQIHGVDTYYVTRALINVDEIMNEDRLSIFDGAYQIEMYIKSVDGFQGQGDFLSKFGLEIRDQITFSVAIRTFERHVTNKIPTQKYIRPNTYTRPKEGDLVYFPMNKKFFEITFVEHESVFYQTGALQIYDLTCELFEYSNESFETGIPELDKFYDGYKTSDVQDLTTLNDIDIIAKNIFYEDSANTFIDFSESDPFSENITFPTNS